FMALLYGNSTDAAFLREQAGHTATIADVYAFGAGDLGFAVDQTGTTTPGLDGQPAPELEPAVHLERLTTIDRLEANAFRAQPLHGFEGTADKDFAQGRVGAIARDAEHV